MEYRLSFNAAQAIFALPCEVVDRYINEASADNLRLLLYLYRHGGGDLSAQTLSDALGISVDKIENALGFWAERQLFTLTPKESGPQAARQAAAGKQPKSVKKAVEAPLQYGADEISSRVSGSPELRFLIDTAPELLGRLLSQSDCSALIYLYDGLGLPADVILMLIEYCASSGHANLRYIEKAALSWAEDGIDTHELAENRIRELEAYRSFEGRIRNAMGITGRALTQTERQHIARWSSWSTPMELVTLAYEICVNRTGKLSFSYINSILSSWHEKGITTVEQAKGENRQKPAKSASYNIDQYVDLSMKRLLNE